MSQVNQLLNLIDNILQSEEKSRRDSAEQDLINLRGSNPNQLMLTFLTILKDNYSISQRNFSCTQLRLCLSNFSHQPYTNIWKNLTLETQNTIKIQLFRILFAEPDLLMKKHIADTLGQIAASILLDDENAWPQFKTNLWQLIRELTGNGIHSAFNILQTFFPCCPTYFKQNSQDLFTLFQNGIKHQNNKIKLSALNCFSSYLSVMQSKHSKDFQCLINDIYNAVYILLVKDKEQQGLTILSNMIEEDSKFFRKNFKQLNQLLQGIFKLQNIQSGVKRMATQILVDYSEKNPTTFRKNKEYLNSMLQMIFYHMIQISQTITEEWKKPEEGYNDDMEDDQDFQTTRFGMSAIDRIIFSVGDKEVLPIISDAIKQLLKNIDWRYQYTAVMALSQIGQYIQDANQISSVIEKILQYFGSQNPMLRYAACHAIGQISDDMNPKYQELYGATTYPKLVQLLKDPIPRVVSHSAAALTNFLEGMKYQQSVGHLNQMMELLVFHSSNGISLVKESCLGAISSVAQMCKTNFSAFLQITVQLLFTIVQTNTSKQYKHLRGQAIETMTIIASSVGVDLFRPALSRLILTMIQIQQSKFDQVDPQKSYILAGWQRLCLVYGQELAAYLDQILPSLFDLVKNVINTQLVSSNSKDDEKQSKSSLKDDVLKTINTYQTEEAQIAISMLNVFIEQLKQLYTPYVENTVQLLCKLISEHSNDDVREEACGCLPSLVSVVKISNKDGAINMTKFFMKTLIETMQKQSDPSIVCIELQTLKNVIQDLDMSFLTGAQIEQFSKKMLELLHESQQNKQKTHSVMKQTQQQGQQFDQDDTKMLNQEIKQIQEVQVTISQVFGILFKTHKDLTNPIAQHLIAQVLPSVLQDNLSENSYKFAIFMIDDMVEHLGYSRLSHHWQKFGGVLLKYCVDKNSEIRQAACYGLGIYAQNTPTSPPNVIQNWLNTLIQSSKIKKGSQKQSNYGHCQNNAIASIGKIIKVHGEHFNCQSYITYWFSFLPLKYDKPQAIIQHEFLVDIMLNKPELILGNVPEAQLSNLIKLLSVFGTILNNHKIYDKNIQEKIKTYLFTLQSLPLFTINTQHIWEQLHVKQKQSLVRLTNS